MAHAPHQKESITHLSKHIPTDVNYQWWKQKWCTDTFILSTGLNGVYNTRAHTHAPQIKAEPSNSSNLIETGTNITNSEEEIGKNLLTNKMWKEIDFLLSAQTNINQSNKFHFIRSITKHWLSWHLWMCFIFLSFLSFSISSLSLSPSLSWHPLIHFVPFIFSVYNAIHSQII